jgi:23S rRNA pseudouridine955/2504/2580 synthase
MKKRNNRNLFFFLKKTLSNFSLLEVKLITGRTHQIRVHLAHLGFPILGDEKYGDYELNKKFKVNGAKRMFLHAMELGFDHPVSKENILLTAPVPKEFTELESGNL